MVKLNERIKELRIYLGLTQEEFGARVGLGKAAVSKIEKGINGTTEQTVRSICREYGASYLWITEGAGQMMEEQDDSTAAHAMVDQIMEGECERVKQAFKIAADVFSSEDWREIDRLLDKLLAGFRPWEE